MEKNIAILTWEPVGWSASGPSIDGIWRKDGPELPVEYTLASCTTQKGRKSVLSLTLRPGWKRNPVLWSMMCTGETSKAVRELALMMECGDGQVGLIDIESGEGQGATYEDLEEVERWAEEQSWQGNRIDAVVWRAQLAQETTSRETVRMLRSLDGKERRDTEAYVRSTPSQLRTPFREMMERELGWTPFTLVERLAPVKVRSCGAPLKLQERTF